MKPLQPLSGIFLSVVYCLSSIVCFAQQDSLYRIGLILPLQTASTAGKLEEYTNAHDVFTAHKIHLNEDAITSLDFYQGVLEALTESKDSLKIELSIYDNWNSDSVTTEILKNPELKKLDVIIGSVSTSTAKLVADYCKQNKIVNIQPFTPSKSLGNDNPYHLKIAPTIDAHTSALYNSIVDSFPGANIIIYTPDAEKSLSIAQHLDSLFKTYNKTATQKFTVSFLNTKDMLIDGKKTTAIEQLKTGKQNIVIITSFEESFVNGNLRLLHEKLEHDSTIIVYGMPTWLNGDILRLDYVNDFNTRISDAFNPDSLNPKAVQFHHSYADRFGCDAGRYAYLGFDLMNFTLYNLKDYGKNFLDDIATQHYSGAVYKFDISKNLKEKASLNYYENRTVNVFMVQNYQLKRVY